MAALERSQVYMVEQSGITVQQAVGCKPVTDGTMHKYKNTDMIEQRLAQNKDKAEKKTKRHPCCVPLFQGQLGLCCQKRKRPPTL
ncbi:hypothetical protein PspLS_09414 [Pyricularia sp. CBS 133598]|nr:hypothetical protein PspLS_09414 [Pyricularia sp. CBS 133598]